MSDFYGLPTKVLENAWLRLEVLAEGGQRIVRLEVPGKTGNILAEVPDIHWPTPGGEYYPRGGHRLWLAPERADVTSLPDEGPLEITERPGELVILSPVQLETGMRKELRISLADHQPAVTVEHRIWNTSDRPTRHAPWGISIVPHGGETILPLGPASPDMDALLPDRLLVLWPYASFADPRLRLEDRFVHLRGMAGLDPIKVGVYAPQGWLGYLREGIWLVKRFDPAPGSSFPDYGCNAESYANASYVELETLGPMVDLLPGQFASHTEHWEIYTGVETPEQAIQLAVA